jgi:hypothetical protein
MKSDQSYRQHSRPANSRRETNNPLTRSYESNGPDVKIRGTASHIAEKYLQLARDAHRGGNLVAAENYLQHAEHYFRLIADAQAGPRAIAEASPEDFGGEDVDRGLPDRFALPEEREPRPPSPRKRFAPPRVVAAVAVGDDEEKLQGESIK